MSQPQRPEHGKLLDTYCVQLGTLVERRHTELALRTAKRQAEDAAMLARHAMQQAQAAEQAKTKFLANMTHELRTPLNAIIGFSEIIKDSQGLPKLDYPEYAKYIHDAGIHLLGIVNGVLDLARIDAGKLDIEEQLVGLDEVMQAAIKPVRRIAERKSISIGRPASLGERIIFVDPTKLKQVFGNLLSNSVKFTPEGGQVRIDTRSLNRGGLAVSISDTGIGIAADHLARVLEPFGQVEDHLTRQNEGAGLGLSIARALVTLHGGDLVLKSEVGVGTTAEVILPAARVRTASAAIAPERRGGRAATA